MEDVYLALRENNADVLMPLELPDEDQLVEIEEQILIQLPHEYREFLLKVSDVIYGSIEPVTVADPQSHTYLPEVAATAWSLGVPRELIPVCEANGAYYCISQEGEILFWQDGELDESQCWSSIWHWAKDVWLES
ncbi:SMI1/KNR4 family protein [Marinobacterium arenosum]|uniref:SMI1/KNR4 family protein n=1 Tax=Marinobacterium arenosum TaxID=2862496 RepID=UPI001C989C09|nr:SMI1/KNR4 family protein [Marinobacterium arenosum]MBY4676956.1 SMI1/KNR4 family protein [Marinobacterium arenosum]